MVVVTFTDMVSIVASLGIMYLLDILGYALKMGLLFVASSMLGVYVLGNIFTNQYIVYSTAWDVGSSSWKTQTVDPNIMAAVVAISTMVSLIFLLSMRKNA